MQWASARLQNSSTSALDPSHAFSPTWSLARSASPTGRWEGLQSGGLPLRAASRVSGVAAPRPTWRRCSIGSPSGRTAFWSGPARVGRGGDEMPRGAAAEGKPKPPESREEESGAFTKLRNSSLRPGRAQLQGGGPETAASGAGRSLARRSAEVELRLRIRCRGRSEPQRRPALPTSRPGPARGQAASRGGDGSSDLWRCLASRMLTHPHARALFAWRSAAGI